jgi:PIN domain nuclease of toxin-antitoxin system
MIIAQARLEGLTIATYDAIFEKYGVSVLDV